MRKLPRGDALFEHLLARDQAALAYWFARTDEQATRAWYRYMELHAVEGATSVPMSWAQNRVELEALLDEAEKG